MRYRLYREQQLHCDMNIAWHFFSSPHNLAKITPKDMGFVVRSNGVDVPIYKGMLIEYIVSPLFGIPIKWRTRISQVVHFHSFTDFQEKGPYAHWNHFHEFIPNAMGVLVKDTVDYELPFGVFGRIVHTLFVKRKLKAIFDYRFDILEKQFNSKMK